MKLQGTQLDESLAEIEALKSQDEEEALELEIARLEAELNPLKKEVQRLSRRQTALESHLAVGKKKTTQLERLLLTRRESFSKTLSPKLSHRGAQLGRLSSNLETCTSQVVNFFESALSNAGSPAQRAPFVSTSSWVDYDQQEDRYSKQMRLYMRRLLSTSDHGTSTTSSSRDASGTSSGSNIDQSTNSGDENSRYFWMKVTDPKDIRFRGVDADTHARHSTELTRLRDLYAPSESSRTSADLELARRTAEVETLKLQLISNNQQTHLAIDEVVYKQRMRELQKKYSRVKAVLARNVDVILPELYAEMAKLQSTPILWADYNLKLSRLHLQRVKIDLIVSNLLKQRSKAVILSCILNTEKNHHLTLHNLLNTMQAEMSQKSKDWSARAATLRQRSSQPPSPPQLEHLRILSQIFEAGLTLNTSKMERVALEAGEKKRSDDVLLETLASREASELAKVKRSINRVQELLYKSSAGKHPVQTPPEIAQACRKMDSSTSSLASSMEALLKEFTIKSRAISDLPKEAKFERDLWTHFFTGKSTLVKAAVEDLQGKIRTAAVSK